MEHIKMIYL